MNAPRLSGRTNASRASRRTIVAHENTHLHKEVPSAALSSNIFTFPRVSLALAQVPSLALAYCLPSVCRGHEVPIDSY